MQGLWKDKRKHFIKDKQIFIDSLRNNFKHVLKSDEYVYKLNKSKNKTVYSYPIFIAQYSDSPYEFDSFYLKSILVYMDETGKYYDYYTKVYIQKSLTLLKYEGEMPIEPFCILNSSKWFIRGYKNTKEYVYGKPKQFTGKWWKVRNSQKKYYSKLSSREKRRHIKKYINNGDWDAEIKTSQREKSIAWDLY